MSDIASAKYNRELEASETLLVFQNGIILVDILDKRGQDRWGLQSVRPPKKRLTVTALVVSIAAVGL